MPACRSLTVEPRRTAPPWPIRAQSAFRACDKGASSPKLVLLEARGPLGANGAGAWLGAESGGDPGHQARPTRMCGPAGCVAGAGGRAASDWRRPQGMGGRMGRPHPRPGGRSRRQGLVRRPGRQLHRLLRSEDRAVQALRDRGRHEPAQLNVDANGIVWYTGNRNGRIGRLDPAAAGSRSS